MRPQLTLCMWMGLAGIIGLTARAQQATPRPALHRPPAATRPPGWWLAPTNRGAAIPPPVSTPLPAAPRADGLDWRTRLAIQVHLDRANFSCGCIDGNLGPRSRLALAAWQRDQGLPETGVPGAVELARLGDAGTAFLAYTVTTNDLAALTSVSDTWTARAAADRLGFATVLEALAERHHATENAIRTLNPAADWPDPPAGTRLELPNPRPARKARAERLVINVAQKTLRAYDAQDRLVALFPCSIARQREKRPSGVLTVVNCAPHPNYVFDPALFREDPEASTITTKLLIPPGPNNPVGDAWVGLNLPGYGIHGTPRPEDIGKTESHGCFRLANWNATKLIGMIRIGMPVQMEGVE